MNFQADPAVVGAQIGLLRRYLAALPPAHRDTSSKGYIDNLIAVKMGYGAARRLLGTDETPLIYTSSVEAAWETGRIYIGAVPPEGDVTTDLAHAVAASPWGGSLIGPVKNFAANGYYGQLLGYKAVFPLMALLWTSALILGAIEDNYLRLTDGLTAAAEGREAVT